MVGGDPAIVIGDNLSTLRTHHHPILGVLDLVIGDFLLVQHGRTDGGQVHQVTQLRPSKPSRPTCNLHRTHRGTGLNLVQVNLQHLCPSVHVGWVYRDGGVEAAWSGKCLV